MEVSHHYCTCRAQERRDLRAHWYGRFGQIWSCWSCSIGFLILACGKHKDQTLMPPGVEAEELQHVEVLPKLWALVYEALACLMNDTKSSVRDHASDLCEDFTTEILLESGFDFLTDFFHVRKDTQELVERLLLVVTLNPEVDVRDVGGELLELILGQL
jgi:hypothetical protein